MWKAPDSRGPILVVDDDGDFRALISAVLGHCGYAVAEASTGEEALEFAASAPPMLAVLDVHLPGISGYELADRMRESGCNTGVRYVALTGFGQQLDKERSASASLLRNDGSRRASAQAASSSTSGCIRVSGT